MYAILRTKKHKSNASLIKRQAHTFRTRPTPNADPAKQHKNKLLFGQLDYTSGVDSALKTYELKGSKVRKNAVIAIEYLLTASPEFFDSGAKNERDERLKNWCEAQVEFIKNKHGAENIICMYLHMDEKTPHIEVFVVPIDPKGKLNCRHYLGGQNELTELQTKYATHNARFGLKRGQAGSRATHQEVKKFYRQISAKAKISNEDVAKAVRIDKPTVAERLDPTKFIENQQNKIYTRITKLFSATVYENKLIAQAKKVLRNWSREKAELKAKNDKLADQVETYAEQLARQKIALQAVQNLKIENKDLKTDLTQALNKNDEFIKLLKKSAVVPK